MKTVNVLEMLDVRDPEGGVQVRTSGDGDKLWINVDGLCVCRVQGIRGSREGLKMEAWGTDVTEADAEFLYEVIEADKLEILDQQEREELNQP